MTQGHLESLAHHARLNYFARGTRLLGAADGVPSTYFVIQRGLVRNVPPGGNADAADTVGLGPGESFPLGALVEGRPVVGEYEAAADTFCYEFGRAAFDTMRADSAPFAAFCTRRLAHLLQESRRLAQSRAFEDGQLQQNMTSLLASLVRRAAVAVRGDDTLGAALGIMHERRIGSIIAIDDTGVPTGIFTERDVIDRVVLAGVPLAVPLEQVMTRAPHCLEETATAFDAALLMARHAIRHVPVVRAGKLVGVVSERDLFSLQRVGMREVSRGISRAADLAGLAAAATDVRLLARNMQAQGMALEQLTQLIVAMNDRVVGRAIGLAAAESGVDPRNLCWIALGSEGRQEQTISSDQDNGLIFAPAAGADPEQLRRRLLPFAAQVNRMLAELGFPLCAGGIMAGNPKWCLCLAEWKTRFANWLRNPTPEALLNAAIFFDFRPLWGEVGLANDLRDWLGGEARSRPAFLRMLAANALLNTPPLNFLGELAASGKVDLKGQGARVFIDCARVLALAQGIPATATAQRLRLATGAGGAAREVDALVDAFHFIQALRVARQFKSLEDGGPPNQIDLATLNELDRRILKETFRQVGKLQRRLKLDYSL